MPHKTAAVSAQVVCTPYNHAPCYFMQSHIRKVYACLAVTCHLHFWQNDRGLLRATAVIRGWNGYRNKSQHRKLTLERKFSRRSCRDSNPRPFDHESGALTTELSPPPDKWPTKGFRYVSELAPPHSPTPPLNRKAIKSSHPSLLKNCAPQHSPDLKLIS